MNTQMLYDQRHQYNAKPNGKCRIIHTDNWNVFSSLYLDRCDEIRIDYYFRK